MEEKIRKENVTAMGVARKRQVINRKGRTRNQDGAAVATKLKERVIGATGSVSGVASILSSWQICHNICLGLIALLGVIGVTVVGMPLLFLTKIAVPIWSLAFVLLAITAVLYWKKNCISRNLMLINTGLVTAGIPFQVLKPYEVVFWVIGGVLVLGGILSWIRGIK